MTEEIVEQIIKDIDNGDWTEYYLYKMCPALLESICDDNGWEFEMDVEDGYDGWEVGWSATIRTDNATISAGGSMYYGTINLVRTDDES